MSETISVGGQSIPKNWLVVGGSVAGAYVVYAWWRSRVNAQPAPVPAVDPELIPQTDRIPAQDSNRQPATGNAIGTADTNAAWTEKALAGLDMAGIDRALATVVLGKLLAHEKMLNQNEADIARAAKAVAGEPPVGGPYPVQIAPAGTAGTPPATPSDVHVTATTDTSITLSWGASAGAERYVVQKSGIAGREPSAYDVTTGTTYTVSGLSPNTNYTMTVMAQNASNVNSPTVTVTGSTTS